MAEQKRVVRKLFLDKQKKLKQSILQPLPDLPGLYEEPGGRIVNVSDVGHTLEKSDLEAAKAGANLPLYYVETGTGALLRVDVEDAEPALGGMERMVLEAVGSWADKGELFPIETRGSPDIERRVHETLEKITGADTMSQVDAAIEGLDREIAVRLREEILSGDITSGKGLNPDFLAKLDSKLLSIVGREYKQLANDPLVNAMPDDVAGAFYNHRTEMLNYERVKGTDMYTGVRKAGEYLDAVYRKSANDRPPEDEIETRFREFLQEEVDYQQGEGNLVHAHTSGLIKDNARLVLDKCKDSWDRTNRVVTDRRLDPEFVEAFKRRRPYLVEIPTDERTLEIRDKYTSNPIAELPPTKLLAARLDFARIGAHFAHRLIRKRTDENLRHFGASMKVLSTVEGMLIERTDISLGDEVAVQDWARLAKDPESVVDLVRAWR